MEFYTNVTRIGKYIHLRGYENDQRVHYKIEYQPYVFVRSNDPTSEWRTLEGKPVEKIQLEGMSEAQQFIDQYKEVQNFPLYGLTNWVYPFINDTFKGEVEYDAALIRVGSLDIEVSTEGGYPSIREADKEIVTIALRTGGRTSQWGTNPYQPKSPDVEYFQCRDELDLIERFLVHWKKADLDVVTGWNIEFFDIPYLIHRIRRVMGDNAAKRLSPLNHIQSRDIQNAWGEQTVYTLSGMAVLDYMALYKKFKFQMQESYKLDHIAFIELGERKLDYSEYEDLNDLYQRNFEKFIDYNIHDVVLVERLEEKLKYIEQVFALAYDGKVNYIDTLTTVRMWDVIIHNYLHDKGIVVPHFEVEGREEGIVGAYVKDPQLGLHKWVVSFDLNSLYPHLIMQYNISPEMLLGQRKEYIWTSPDHTHDPRVQWVLDGAVKEFWDELFQKNVAFSPSGCMFKKDEQGFLPALMQKMYDDRVRFKKEMIEAKQKLEELKAHPEPGRAHQEAITKLEYKIAQKHNMQMAKKIQLNSAYGALGNKTFRWFDKRLGESVTMGGQLSIRWMEQRINKFLNELFKTEGVDYVIACDTDSMYITLDRLIEQVCPDKTVEQKVNFIDKVAHQKLEPFIDKCYVELAEYMNAYQQKMVMKRECIADKGIWVAKKRYILNVWDQEGVRYTEPYMKIMGIEAVRSSTPSACRANIKQGLKIILNKTEDDIIKFIEQKRLEWPSLPLDEISFPRGLNDMNKYESKDEVFSKGCPMHVRGALIYNHMLKVKGVDKKYQALKSGDKIKFAYMRKPNPCNSHVIAFPDVLPKELDLDRYIDYDAQFEKGLLAPLQNILDAIGWKSEHVSSLEAFFG